MKVQLLLLLLLMARSLSKNEGDKSFRVNKLNMIWKKLQNKMSASKLQMLKRELLDHENKQMNWKELKLHGGDEDGGIEASLRRSLFGILEKYGHGKLLGNVPEPLSQQGVDDNNIRGGDHIGDARLKHLWKLAEKHGKFDDEEMAQLRTEFEHHMERVREYNTILNTLQEQHEISDNSVKSHDKMKDHEIDELKSDLKDKYIEMKKHYKQLKERVTGEVVQTPFRDYRVIELWEQAKANNFSEQELESIKEELHDFENKIGKHEHYKNAAKKSERKLNKGINIDVEAYKEYAKKAKQHLKYMKRLHHTLLEKISRRDEL